MESEEFKLPIGSPLISFDMKGTDGRNYMPKYYMNRDLLVVVFTCNHCPYAQAYEDRILAIAREFSRNVAFFAINSNDASKYPQDSLENMRIRARDKNYPFPYLHDERQDVARAFGALVTPHAFVFDQSNKLAYQGGIDDNWQDPKAVAKQYLRDAIVELLARRRVTRQTAPVIGCSIKWKDA